MQESFIFYKSYSEAIKQLNEKDQLKALWAIINHSIDEEEQQVDGLANIVYIMAKPQIEANNKRKNDGLKGGRPIKEIKETSGYSNTETTGFENKKPNVNVNINKNNNVNVNENENIADASALTPSKKTQKFIPPDLEEVRAYCLEQNYAINPDAFVAFYESKGWKIGKETMKDWKKAASTWEIREKERIRKEVKPGHFDMDDIFAKAVTKTKRNKLGAGLFDLFSGEE